MFSRSVWLTLLTAAVCVHAQRGDKPTEPQPDVPAHLEVPPAPTLSPEEALRTFSIAPGFRLEIAAADPLVHDPVAMTFGPDGRMWVVEMSGFMRDADGTGEDAPSGSIAVLEDTDLDGRFDKRTTFLSGLVMPRAVALVDDGVLVAEPPNLWFCRDRDGDGQADEKKLVSPAYGNPHNPEHTANGLLWAIDNWIYNANYSQRFRYTSDGHFNNDTTHSRGQWGITQDDTGRIFYNHNSFPLRGDLVPAEYYRRNPFLTRPGGINLALAPQKLRVWPARVTPGVNRGYKTLDEKGKITEVTAACGPVIYRGALFPAEFNGNAFICEPAGNLVKRLVFATAADGTLEARNAYDGHEFLASTDERFRPVNLANGPDGALYVVDMYRGIIQHRIYMTSFLRRQIDERGLAQGIGMGRIYRIVPENAPRAPKVRFDLATESSARLVARLAAANSWWRDTAQRLLVERRDPTATPLLRDLARSADATPLGRLHALWALHGTDELDSDTVLGALASSDARVNVAAIRFAEKWFAASEGRALFTRITELVAGGSAPEIVQQAAFSLGEARGPDAIAALAQLAARHGRQPFIADALVSGLAGREGEFLPRLAQEPAFAASEAASATVTLAASAVLKARDTARDEALFALLAPTQTTPAWMRLALLRGVERFLPKTPEGVPLAGTLPSEPTPLLALATRANQAGSREAARLVGLLKWPGKPGFTADDTAAAASLSPADQQLFIKGREIYTTLCAACHQPNGEGLPGLAPQLLHSRYVLGAEHALARIVLNGKEKDGLVMPPLQSLDDESIAAALTYVRRAWGHTAAPVSPDTVKAVRALVATREAPWSDEELQSVSP